MRARPISLALVTVLALSAATSVQAHTWPRILLRQPALYQIRGYLDRAPADALVIDRIEVAAGRVHRPFLVTSYRTPGTTSLDRYLSRSLNHRYLLSGPRADVERLISAPPGGEIAGTFVAYTDGPPSLLIAELELPAASARKPSR